MRPETRRSWLGPKAASHASALLPAVLFLALFACACRHDRVPRNFLLITLDTQRADHIGAYDPSNARTPQLDSLAEAGLVFRNCYSLIPITLPSHASLFFSEPPHVLRNYNNGQVIHPRQSRPSLAAIFKKRGFRTAAFVSLGILDSQFGLAEGFDTFGQEFLKDRWYLTAEEVNGQVLPWLDQNAAEPFFLWVHYSDPHDPYAVPSTPADTKIMFNGTLLGDQYCLSKYLTYRIEVRLKRGKNTLVFEVDNPYDPNPDHFQARLDKVGFSLSPDLPDLDISFSRGWLIRRPDDVYFFKKSGTVEIINHGPEGRPFILTFRGKLVIPVDDMKRHYREEVEYMDAEIGRLWAKMRELGLFETTAVLVVGDHGEGLGEYLAASKDRHVGHIHYLYNAYMKVPLILRVPQGAARERTEDVTLLDVAPTIAGVMDFRRPSFYQGRDLLRLKKNEKLTVFEETYKPEAVWDKFAVLRSPWHLIFTPSTKAYELFNLDRDPEEKTDLLPAGGLDPEVLRLKQELERLAREILLHKKEVGVDKRHEEMLKSLGYLGN